MTGYNLIELDEILSELEEDEVKSILFEFSCPLNKDVEDFIHNKAIEFSKQGLSKTTLVFTSYQSEPILIGYFTIKNNYLVVDPKKMSKSTRKKLVKFATYDNETRNYILPAILIGQFSKNFSVPVDLITGKELLSIAIDRVKKAQSLVGGKVVYLECQDNEKLTKFYEENNFKNFGIRHLEDGEKCHENEEYLVQMLRYIKS